MGIEDLEQGRIYNVRTYADMCGHSRSAGNRTDIEDLQETGRT